MPRQWSSEAVVADRELGRPVVAGGERGSAFRTEELAARRHRRGWLVRRMLLAADVIGLGLAFLAAELWFGTGSGADDRFGGALEPVFFLATLPGWIVVAKLYGLYDRDEERTHHSTVDEAVGVFNLVTVGSWLFFMTAWLTKFARPTLPKLLVFWALAIVLVTAARASARAYCRRSVAYLQNTIVVGAGDVGQIVARKILQHPEYGLNLVGFVDDAPRERRDDLEHLTVLGGPDRLMELVRLLDVERVVIAFSNESHRDTLELIRKLKGLDVQIDVVPRLYEIVGPRVGIHNVEGLPLVGLSPGRPSRSSRMLKRAIDVAGASIGLALTAPLFAYVALRIKRDSAGPVFFRQVRLGADMREFQVLKFRTMHVDTDPERHREYIRRSMRGPQPSEPTGLYKLDGGAVTGVGRWLRRTSLDELPQLINVLRGEMSLVGPRPCIPYETESFEQHHFERFLVPAGLTGLWQVTARARTTFAEALDMDVAYVRGWSLGLDLRLLCKTPFLLLGSKVTT